jgi:hypothetical protein
LTAAIETPPHRTQRPGHQPLLQPSPRPRAMTPDRHRVRLRDHAGHRARGRRLAPHPPHHRLARPWQPGTAAADRHVSCLAPTSHIRWRENVAHHLTQGDECQLFTSTSRIQSS